MLLVSNRTWHEAALLASAERVLVGGEDDLGLFRSTLTQLAAGYFRGRDDGQKSKQPSRRSTLPTRLKQHGAKQSFRQQVRLY